MHASTARTAEGPGSRQRFTRARRAVCVALAVFLVAQVLLAVAVEGSLPELCDPAYGLKLKQLRARLRACAAPPELVVALGSSRVAHGFDGALLEDDLGRQLGRPAVLYNLGRLGGGPISECLYLHRLLAEGIRPNRLLVEVLPRMLTRAASKAEMESLEFATLDPADVAVLERFGAMKPRLPWWVQRSFPERTHRQAFLHGVAPLLLPRDVRAQWDQQWWKGLDCCGWKAIEHWGDNKAIEKYHVKVAAPFQDELARTGLPGNLPGCRALEEVLRLAREGGIETALVMLPEGKALRPLWSAEAREHASAYLRHVQAEFGCPLIDASEWVAAEEDFVDPDHLTVRGARAFTEQFGREFLGPWLLRSSPGEQKPADRTVRR
jgi:hypothetical protein